MSELTNFLTDLAEQVKAAHDAVVVAERTAAEKAIEAGALLCQAKDACKHGDWLPFLRRSGVADRQAQRFMQIAKSGLKSDTVADLGIKGTLEYLTKRKLPIPGFLLTVGKVGWTESEERFPLTIISCSKTHAGRFDCAQIILSDDESVIEELPPVSAPGALAFIETHRIPASEREFIMIPEAVIDPPEDITEGVVPESYRLAIKRMQECVQDFTPERYVAAVRAVQICEAASEKWPISSKLLETYRHLAKDDELMVLASKVQRMASSYGVRP